MKDTRKKINKKINDNYNKRQKVLAEIKNGLDIEFGKIKNYKDEIIISYKSIKNIDDNSDKNKGSNKSYLTDSHNKNNNHSNDSYDERTSSLFRVQMPDSIMGISQFYYKDKEINSLTLTELSNLQKDMDYILKELEKEIDNTLD